jgi:cysteine desulfurase
MAMGVSEEQASSTIRVSLGPETTQEEVDSFVRAWSDLYGKKVRNDVTGLD